MKKIILSLTLSALLCYSANSQTTGSFQLTITHNTLIRSLEYYVPIDYDDSNLYPMVVGLHGCGGLNNAATFRDRLQFLSDSVGAIVVCPQGQSSLGGYLGDPDNIMILTAIDTSIGRYNIDTNAVFLTGFSCNGYTAASEGTYELYNWAGIIPFNAALFPDDFTDGSFNFSTQKPICVCIGTADPHFSENNRFEDSLIENSNIHLYNIMPGIGHTVNFPTFNLEMMKCFDWLDSLKQNTVSTGTIYQGEIFDFFPNPADRNLIVKNNSTEEIEVSIIDMSGKVVVNLKSNSSSISIDTEGIVNGTYLVQVITNDNLVTRQKLLVNH